MDAARYYIALFIVAFAPGVFLFWFSIHPLVAFWRRIGPVLTLCIHFGVIFLLAAAVFVLRDTVLAIEYGRNTALIGVSLLLFMLAGWVRFEQNKQLKIRALIGLPELAPGRYQDRLATEGIYSRIRHPRYVEIVLAFFACALFSNYLAAYAVAIASVAWVLMLVPVEEKELRERFGEEYVRYARQVPRFIPRLLRK